MISASVLVLNGEAKAIAFIIADKAKDIWRHIIMGEDNRVFLFLKRVNRVNERGVGGHSNLGIKSETSA